jgi:hypothetical protein
MQRGDLVKHIYNNRVGIVCQVKHVNNLRYALRVWDALVYWCDSGKKTWVPMNYLEVFSIR